MQTRGLRRRARMPLSSGSGYAGNVHQPRGLCPLAEWCGRIVEERALSSRSRMPVGKRSRLSAQVRPRAQSNHTVMEGCDATGYRADRRCMSEDVLAWRAKAHSSRHDAV
ncbi:hypothetical protein Micbo1qcDRAFT_39707 [Microdochium bolleyi]|uniref:Uncharacterized protein n=1 Tax=Microdochium bolleyi TaxID=196109 RepID=A0A136J9Q8_9PEZI|nr:hypothetical protein Micbo1qcDRAFT_39707 [Microdochium bolleyi]